MNICDANVEYARPSSDCDDVESERPIAALIQIDIHVLAGVVTANGRYDRVARLATHNKPIELAHTCARSLKIELEEVESDLAYVWLSRNSHRTSARVGEWCWGAWIAEIRSIEPDRLAAASLDYYD